MTAAAVVSMTASFPLGRVRPLAAGPRCIEHMEHLFPECKRNRQIRQKRIPCKMHLPPLENCMSPEGIECTPSEIAFWVQPSVSDADHTKTYCVSLHSNPL